jgi:hypothetical protein
VAEDTGVTALEPRGQAPVPGFREAWEKIPPGPRLVIPIALLLTAVVVGFYAWAKPSRTDWSLLPSRLVCQVQSGSVPAPAVTVASVAVAHPGGNVLQLVVRFTQPLPPGYKVTYSIVNNGTQFARLGPVQGTGDMAISAIPKTEPTGGAAAWPGRETHAARTSPDTVEISLDLTKFGIDKGLVSPAMTVSSQLNAPPAEPVAYAGQICHG